MSADLQKRIFFYVVVLFSLYLAYLLLRPYLGMIVFALVTVVSFIPIFDWLLKKFRGRKGLATITTIAFIFIVVLIPLVLLVNITILQAFQFSRDVSLLLSGAGERGSLDQILARVNKMLADVPIPYVREYQLTQEDVIYGVQNVVRPVGSYLAAGAVNLTSASAEWIVSFIYVTLLAAIFPRYPKLIQTFKDLSPLDEEINQRYVDRLTEMTKSMARGVFIIAVAQGLAMGIFFWIGGVRYTAFWTLLAVFLAMLPLGSGLIGIPIGIVQIVLGNVWQGILILLGYALVVSNIDYFLRPRMVTKQAHLPPVLVLLSAFGGLSLFGFLGVIYGPVLMIFLLTTIQIYVQDFNLAKGKSEPEAEPESWDSDPVRPETMIQ